MRQLCSHSLWLQFSFQSRVLEVSCHLELAIWQNASQKICCFSWDEDWLQSPEVHGATCAKWPSQPLAKARKLLYNTPISPVFVLVFVTHNQIKWLMPLRLAYACFSSNPGVSIPVLLAVATCHQHVLAASLYVFVPAWSCEMQEVVCHGFGDLGSVSGQPSPLPSLWNKTNLRIQDILHPRQKAMESLDHLFTCC